MEHLIGTEDIKSPTPFDINVFGEYNIGGDLWEVKPIFEKIGYRIVSSLTGDGSFHRISQAHQAKLSILLCHRSINYTNRMMEEKYGVPWLKVNYIGTKGTEKSLRKMAEFFDNPELTRKTEEVIAEEKAKYAEDIEKYRKKLKGKTAFVYAGGSRSHHYINLFEELGMGSALAFKGIENTMVLYHGSQGCSTYMRLLLAHHFREPVDIASSSLSEKGAVYGGKENLKKGLRNVINRYNPKVIGVATTCLAETIGDDVPAIIREFKEEEGIGDDLEKDIIIIPVSTPSYGESHVSGYIKALDAVVRKFAEKPREESSLKVPNERLNVIPVESLSPADVRELKEIFEVMAGDYIFLPDISETFDAPLREDIPRIAPGGTTLSEIADMHLLISSSKKKIFNSGISGNLYPIKSRNLMGFTLQLIR